MNTSKSTNTNTAESKKELAKDLEISVLLDFYGEMLTQKQRDFVEYYYNDDLSLAEIAETANITRQGVRDAIKRAREQLVEFEEKLGFVERYSKIVKGLEDIKKCSNEIQTENYATALSSQINDLTVRIESICEELEDFDL